MHVRFARVVEIRIVAVFLKFTTLSFFTLSTILASADPTFELRALKLLLKPLRPAHLNRCVIPSLVRLIKKLMQVEAFIQFFLGYYAHDMTYQDDLVVSVKRNLSSLSGFWFDCVTSIPWSYMDLYFYLVIFQPAPSLCSHCLLHYSKKN